MAGNKNTRSVNKYLANYAEAEIEAVLEFPQEGYQHVVLIPAYQESSDFVTRFVRQFRQKKVLLIVVINQPEDDEDNELQQLLWQQLCDLSCTVWQANNLQLQIFEHSAVQVLLVDRFSKNWRIAKKYGVGLARKIAADIASALIQNNRINESQIYSTDADAELPEDYFQKSYLKDNTAAGVFHFRHISCGEPRIDEATQLYERRLHYYVEGLKFAGSPYAFHTIGSCLCFDMLAYCQARGFPRKSGGEDFYLLNKLAKFGAVIELQPTIDIRSRVSSRVPFGTGPAVASIIEKQQQEDTYLVYHPQIFVRLQNLITLLPQLCFRAISAEDFCQKLDAVTLDFLEISDFFKHYQKWQKQYKGEGLLLTLMHWFDAFKTLKYVHFQREVELPDVDFQSAIRLSETMWQ